LSQLKLLNELKKINSHLWLICIPTA